ncbi:MAG: N-acetylmuramoyl-L-alanine amidase family protein [Salibacteraceae bacterium]
MLEVFNMIQSILKNINLLLLIKLVMPFGFLMLTSFYPFHPGEYGLNKVVIDAGHGGKDPGAIGVDKMQEKNVTLDIALKVGEQIKMNHPNVKVVYTRDSDVFIGLTERAKVANQMNADLFISIHADAAGSSQAYGTETFALGLHKSAANLETAKRENQAILLEDNYEVKYEGFDPTSDESLIAIGLLQQASLTQSLTIASKVQEQFTKIGRRDRGVKQAGFVVLWKTTMPSVLIETGFITNVKEGRFLNKGENRATIANCIYKAFDSYKSDLDKLYAPNERKVEPKTKTVVNDNGVRFRVQVMSSPTQLDIKPQNFKGFSDVRELKTSKGSYKYTIGNETTFEDGVNLQKKVREKGYKDAFLIGVYNGSRISVAEANSIIKKNSK